VKSTSICESFAFPSYIVALSPDFVVVIKPENPYFASYLGLEVKPPGVYPFGPHAYFFSSLVWRTKVGIRTGRWWICRLHSGNTAGIRGLGYE